MTNEKLNELAVMLGKAQAALNELMKPKPYMPKKGDRVEVLVYSGLWLAGERGTVMEAHACPWLRMDREAGGVEVVPLDIEKGHGLCMNSDEIRPLTPEEIAEEEKAKLPKVGDWVRHTDGSTGQVKDPVGIVSESSRLVSTMGGTWTCVPVALLTVIPKP